MRFLALALCLVAMWNSFQYLRRPQICPDCKGPNYHRMLNLACAVVFAVAAAFTTAVLT